MNRRFDPAAVWPTATELLLSAAAVGVAAAAFAPYYQSTAWVLPIVVGVLAATLVVTPLAFQRRWPWWAVAAAALAALPLMLIYTLYRPALQTGLPGPDAWRAVGEGLRSGPIRMLSVTLPADPAGDLLVLPVGAAFVAAATGALLVLRSRAVIPIAVPALPVFLAGSLISGQSAGRPIIQAGALLVVLLVLVLFRGNRTAGARLAGPSATGRTHTGPVLRTDAGLAGRIGFGLPVVAVVSVAAVLAGHLLPVADGSDRFDPRSVYQPPIQINELLSPLVRLRPQLTQNPATPVFTVGVQQSSGTPIDRVRISALDSFDGALWTQSRDFPRAGSRLPDGPALAQPLQSITLDVTLQRPSGPFLPVAGQPVTTDATGIGFDAANSTLVSAVTPAAGYRYRVTSNARIFDNTLTTATVSQTPADQHYAQLPDPPSWLLELARTITQGWQTPIDQLLAIEKYLQGQGYSVTSRPGHSYGAVERTLRGETEERTGTAEQYASAFALLARALGYPARVAVGYRLNPAKKDANGRYQVDTSDAHAWPEVHLTGFGWMPLEPTNPKNATAATPPREKTAPVLPDDPADQQAREPRVQDNNAEPGRAIPGGGGAARAAGLALILLILLLLLIPAGIWAAKYLRRRSRTQGDSTQRVVAAWREVTDRLLERGVAIEPTRTPVEVAADAGRRFPAATAPLAELALIVTTAICAQHEAPVQAAERAWKLEREVTRGCDRKTGWAVRIRALFDPRPLLPQRLRRTKRSGRPVPDLPVPPAETAKKEHATTGTAGGVR